MSDDLPSSRYGSGYNYGGADETAPAYLPQPGQQGWSAPQGNWQQTPNPYQQPSGYTPWDTPAYAQQPPHDPGWQQPQQNIGWQHPQQGWQMPMGYPPPRRRRPWLWVTAIVAVVVIAVGTTVFFTVWGKSEGRQSWVADTSSTLRGVYPDEPTAGWTVTIDDVEEVAGEDLGDFEFGGARDYGNVLLTIVETSDDYDDEMLVAIDASTGAVLWVTPSEGHSAYDCADEAIDGLLICATPVSPDDYEGEHELRFYRTDTGELDRTERLSDLRSVAVADGAVYTAGFDGSDAWVARGTVDDLEANWRVENDFGDCPTPEYWTTVGAEGNVVWYENFLLDAATGESLNPESTYGFIVPGGQLLATTECTDSDQSESERRTWDIIDFAGETQWSHTVTGPGWIVRSPGAPAGSPYFVGNSAFDSASGELLWEASDDVEMWVVYGDTVLASETMTEDEYDYNTVAFDVATGDELWSDGDFTFCDASDGQRCISTFYDDDNSSEVNAINLTTGDQDWSLGTIDSGVVSRAGDGFVVIDYKSEITYYPPPAS